MVRPLRPSDRDALVALADERGGRWWRLRAGLPAEPGSAEHRLVQGVVAAAVLVDDDRLVGFGSVHEPTGHDTAFVEVEVVAGAPVGVADRFLAVILEALARPSGVRRAFLRRAVDDAPLDLRGWSLQARLPEAVYFAGARHDVDVHAIDL